MAVDAVRKVYVPSEWLDVDFYYEILDHSRRLVRRAQQEINSAGRTRRVNAAMAVPAGVPKIDILNRGHRREVTRRPGHRPAS